MRVSNKAAQDVLRKGGVLAVPTETVFGMAADVTQESAILSLYNLKKREARKPLVIQLAHKQDLTPYLSQVPFDLEKLMERFWPGPLTLILPIKEHKVSGLLTAHKPYAGFRISAHEEVRRFIAEYGPLAVTSANFSGKKDLLSASEVEEVFGLDFPILDCKNEECLGIPSTVLAYVDASWVILRLGALKLEQLKQVLRYYPSVVEQLNLQKQTYVIRTQLHLKEQPYDGSIPVVLGIKGKEYPHAESIHLIGDLDHPNKLKKQFAQVFQQIQNQGYPHVWVDLDFPKEGPLKKLSELLQHAVMTSL